MGSGFLKNLSPFKTQKCPFVRGRGWKICVSPWICGGLCFIFAIHKTGTMHCLKHTFFKNAVQMKAEICVHLSKHRDNVCVCVYTSPCRQSELAKISTQKHTHPTAAEADGGTVQPLDQQFWLQNSFHAGKQKTNKQTNPLLIMELLKNISLEQNGCFPSHINWQPSQEQCWRLPMLAESDIKFAGRLALIFSQQFVLHIFHNF